ncbi:hypothetical protein IE077_003391 [Cardiosporidium cionae]|uniref:Uncharacterized protein n=1 Tax=Cardiosporidium cionae TaxID=476202 RepID=A0ABQ7JF19_9APIC|nr:hypothetical protein IE077_003391 [Cardiosporidium cionae]|eukprot:KAF8822594.1 hypothetical protein IE077_003391 [Cardiosporidium cionae]
MGNEQNNVNTYFWAATTVTSELHRPDSATWSYLGIDNLDTTDDSEEAENLEIENEDESIEHHGTSEEDYQAMERIGYSPASKKRMQADRQNIQENEERDKVVIEVRKKVNAGDMSSVKKSEESLNLIRKITTASATNNQKKQSLENEKETLNSNFNENNGDNEAISNESENNIEQEKVESQKLPKFGAGNNRQFIVSNLRESSAQSQLKQNIGHSNPQYLEQSEETIPAFFEGRKVKKGKRTFSAENSIPETERIKSLHDAKVKGVKNFPDTWHVTSPNNFYKAVTNEDKGKVSEIAPAEAGKSLSKESGIITSQHTQREDQKNEISQKNSVDKSFSATLQSLMLHVPDTESPLPTTAKIVSSNIKNSQKLIAAADSSKYDNFILAEMLASGCSNAFVRADSEKGKASMLQQESNASFTEMCHEFGILSAVKDTFFGGTSNQNPENWKGGNKGSFFNFMYPENSDYPWSCMCDESDLRAYRAKEQKFVRCRNQVDLSWQKVQSYCDLENPASRISYPRPFIYALLIALISLISFVFH